MKVTDKKEENRQAVLTVEMEPAEVEEYLEKAYRKMVKKVQIPGFRKGKAPRPVLESHVGKDSLLEDALNNLLPRACEEAIKEQQIEAFAQPTVELTQTKPVVFKATVPLPPAVELGKYDTVKVKQKKATVRKADVTAILEQLRHQRAIWEPVERPVQFDDLVILDVDGTVEGKAFINREGAQYPVRKDASYPAQGFADELLGMKRDEEKGFKLTFPKDHPEAELVGKEASFRVKIIEVKEEKLPELDDELAKGLDSELKTLEALRQRIATNLKHRAEEKARQDFEDEVIGAAVKMSRVEYPPLMVDVEVDRMIGQQMQQLQQQVSSPEEFRQRLNEMPAAKVRQEIRPAAEERLTRSLVLAKIATEEKIEVSDKEIDAEIELLTQDTAAENKEEQLKLLNAAENREQFKQVLLMRKTIEGLLDRAKGATRRAKKKQNDSIKKKGRKEAK